MNLNSVEGKVVGLTNMGGIFFIKIIHGNKIINIIGRRDITEDPDRLRAIKRGDYCKFEVEETNNDILVKKLIIKLRGSSSNSIFNYSVLELTNAYDCILRAMRAFYSEFNFVEVQPPTLHYGTIKGSIFPVDLFGNYARLTSSNALYLNIFAQQFCQVYSIQRCFRAEKSNTNRHLAEFDMNEMAILGKDMYFAMEVLESLIKSIIRRLSESPYRTLIRINIDDVLNNEFPVREYWEIEKQYNIKTSGLGKYERCIAQSTPEFVINYPIKYASWTAERLNQKYAKSFNLILPNIGEVAEGCQRNTDIENMKGKFDQAGKQEQLQWYLDNHEYDKCLLAGYGIGIGRLAMWLFGLENIRNLFPFYRDRKFSEQKRRAIK